MQTCGKEYLVHPDTEYQFIIFFFYACMHKNIMLI